MKKSTFKALGFVSIGVLLANLGILAYSQNKVYALVGKTNSSESAAQLEVYKTAIHNGLVWSGLAIVAAAICFILAYKKLRKSQAPNDLE